MGLFTGFLLYQAGKRRGRKAQERRQASDYYDERDPECINYGSFCMNYGSCDGMQCEYE
jgi:hypothetical protein